jgi:soluble lytic murein transglycosylase-like protein
LIVGAALAGLLAGCTSSAFPGLSGIVPRPAAQGPLLTAAVEPAEVADAAQTDAAPPASADTAPEEALPAPEELRVDGAVVVAATDLAATANIDGLIRHYAGVYKVPEALVRRVVARESGYNPKAKNGPYYGLMQIRYETAQSMGYRGAASGLLDAETNLRYGVKYLSGAYLVGGRNADQAVRNFARGYYYDAKRRGLLKEAGLR